MTSMGIIYYSSIIPQGVSAHANYAIYAPIQAPARHGNRLAMTTDRLLGSLRFGAAYVVVARYLGWGWALERIIHGVILSRDWSRLWITPWNICNGVDNNSFCMLNMYKSDLLFGELLCKMEQRRTRIDAYGFPFIHRLRFFWWRIWFIALSTCPDL